MRADTNTDTFITQYSALLQAAKHLPYFLEYKPGLEYVVYIRIESDWCALSVRH